MSYTRTWDETQPLDTVFADTLCQQIRDLKDDIRERFDSFFGIGNWALDPVLGTLSLTKIVPAASFSFLRTVGSLSAAFDTATGGILCPTSTAFTAVYGVRLPPLSTFTGFNVLAKVPTGGSPLGAVVGNAYYQQYSSVNTGIAGPIATVTCAVNGAFTDNVATMSPVSVTVDAMLSIDVVITGGSTSVPNFLAVKLAYTMQFSSVATIFPQIIAL